MDSSSDWPSGFQELKTIDALLRCPICYEYMEAAVSLRTCLHSFCSVCVRRYLRKYQKDCPQCHGAAVEADVIANRPLGELVDKFKSVRGRLLKATVALTTAGTSAPTPPSTTELVRTEQPVASLQASGVTKKRRPEHATSVQMATLTQNYLLPLDELCNGLGTGHHAEALPHTYQFSEAWDQPVAISDAHRPENTARAESSGFTVSGGGGAASTMTCTQDAAVPEPPLSMPDTQQIMDSGDTALIQSDTQQIMDSGDTALIQPDTTTAAVAAAGPASLPVSTAVDVSLEGTPLLNNRLPSFPASTAAQPASTAAQPAGTATQPAAMPSGRPVSGGVPSQDPGSERVPCPVCSVLIPSRSVNAHLDRCLGQEGQMPQLPSPPSNPVVVATGASFRDPILLEAAGGKPRQGGLVLSSSAAPAAKKGPGGRKPMSRLVYTLLSDKQLRKHLKDNGLPVLGNRQAMIKRHQEFVLRYNADADSSRPRTAAEIVKAIEEEERARGLSSVSSGRRSSTPAQRALRFESHHSIDDKDKLRQDYASHHQQHFNNLITQVRSHRAQKEAKDSGSSSASMATATASTASSSSSLATNHPTAGNSIRSSLRLLRSRSSPRVQPPPKRRKTVKRSLPLSDASEGTLSDSDTDVDPGDFLDNSRTSPSRRSSRKRPVRQPYIDMASLDDDASFQLGSHTALRSPPTSSSQRSRQQPKRRSDRTVISSSQETTASQPSTFFVPSEHSGGATVSGLSQASADGACAVQSDCSAPMLDHADGACAVQSDCSAPMLDHVSDQDKTGNDSDATVDFNGPDGEEEVDLDESQPMLASAYPLQRGEGQADGGDASIPEPNCMQQAHSAVVTSPITMLSNDAGAETQYVMDDSTPDSSMPLLSTHHPQVLPTTPSHGQPILAEETQLTEDFSPSNGQRYAVAVKEFSNRIIEETQDCAASPFTSPDFPSPPPPPPANRGRSSSSNTSLDKSPARAPVGGRSRLSRHSRQRNNTVEADSQVADPTYDPFVVQTIQQAVQEADTAAYKRNLRRRK